MKKIVIAFLGVFVFIGNIYAETAMTENHGVSSAEAILAKSQHDSDLDDAHLRVNDQIVLADSATSRYSNLPANQEETQTNDVVAEASRLTGASQNRNQEAAAMDSVITSVAEPARAITTQELIARLTSLENSNRMLLEQVAQLTEKIHALESGTKPAGLASAVVKKEPGAAFAKIRAHINGLKDYLGPQLFMIIAGFIIFIILMLLIKIIFPRRRTVADVSYPQDDLVAKEQDFNLMEGQEGNAAKLNLARAYIEMGHDSKAQSMLYDVLAHGSDSEQEEAKSLLDKIKQK